MMSLVGDDAAGGLAIGRRLDLGGVVVPPRGRNDPNEPVRGIDESLQLAASCGGRTVDRLRAGAPVSPAEG
jgi:hypothetical protein